MRPRQAFLLNPQPLIEKTWRRHQCLKTKYIKRKSMFWRLFYEYSNVILLNSSAHGLKHIALGHHIWERLFWTVGVLLAGVGSAWLSLSTWSRYQGSPTVISLEKNYLDWNTSLSGATVCPTRRVNPELAAELSQARFPEIPVEEGVRRLELLANASYWNFKDIKELSRLKPEEYLRVSEEILFNFSYSVSTSNSEQSEPVLAVTELGLCYVLNSLTADYLTRSYWTEKQWKILPKKKISEGNPLDGDVYAQIIDMNIDVNVAIHGPNDPPEAASKWYYLAEKRYLTLEMTALTIYSSPYTRGLSVAQRKCRFMEESNLETSPVYSYNGCRSECRMRLTHRLCGCIPHFYRNLGDYKTCGVSGMLCLSKYEDRLRKLVQEDGSKEKCDCQPACDQTMYAIQSDGSVDWFLGTNFKFGLVKYPTSRLKRDLVFGMSDLLVQFGGSVGLCFGCSILSIAEFLYFFSLRLFWFVWKKCKRI